jgi:undecaprenyl-phosphate glucose phosphotransferase
VIAGAGSLGQHLAKSLMDLPWLGIRFLGFFDDHKLEEKTSLPGEPHVHPVMGDLDGMVTFVRNYQVNMVYLALPLRAQARLRGIIEKLQDTTASVYFAPDTFIFSWSSPVSPTCGAFPSSRSGRPHFLASTPC